MPGANLTKQDVHSRILGWYRRGGRDLPWRHSSHPYRILISEMMLQQTQVGRVVPKYRQFLKAFPSVSALASASRGAVLAHWQGLGYNRRALWLHDTAREIRTRWRGRFPESYDALRDLPGIGEYTARALLAFAFRQQEPVVDVNIRRVLSRIFRKDPKAVTVEYARSVLPPGKAYEWNQALMDIGSLYCTSRRPDCAHCPASRTCRSAHRVKPAPLRPQRTEPSRYGIPRRIYRGRILKALADRSPITGRQLASRIGLREGHADLAWLFRLATILAAEGFLRIVHSRSPWSVRRVR